MLGTVRQHNIVAHKLGRLYFRLFELEITEAQSNVQERSSVLTGQETQKEVDRDWFPP